MLDTLRKNIWDEMDSFVSEVDRKYGLRGTSPLLSLGIKDFVMRRGKMVRPLLFIIGYLGYSKKNAKPSKSLIRASLAIELLHDFLLIHDDVIDKSALRRGKPTLHRVFNSKLKEPAVSSLGESLAIVAGDIVYAMAIEALLAVDEAPRRKERALRELIHATVYTGAGEFIDVVNGEKGIDSISLKDVFLTYDLKTARYTFVCPLVMGAALAGAAESELAKLAGLGINLGRAFQIQDDLLDMFSSRKELGKPTLSDLGESKKTLLVWKAYRSLPRKDKITLKRFLEKNKKTYSDLLKFRRLVTKSGARDHCSNSVAELLLGAYTRLYSLKINSKQETLIKELIEGLFTGMRSNKRRP